MSFYFSHLVFSGDDGHGRGLMRALADEEEDARPDDGAIEIDSDEEYQ
jgi:hypothetical protein